jgi:hypothetical protein
MRNTKYKRTAAFNRLMKDIMKKSLLITLLAVIIVGGLISGSTLHFGTAQDAKKVSGIISTDTVWTKANSPYMLTGNVLVSNGVTLTIEAGTTVNLNTLYIMVNGTLVARGNSADQISFQRGQLPGDQVIFAQASMGWNEQKGSGSIVENTFFNGTGITINGGSPKITNNLIEHGAVTIEGGSPVITNSKFYASQVKVNGGSPVISGNDILGGKTVGFEVQYFTPITIDGGSPVITKNYIHDAGKNAGIEIKQGNPYIYGNNVSGSQPNIRANVGVIERNYFDGIIEIGNVTVKNNTVNSIEVQGSSSPTITYNNIVSIRLSSSTNVDAVHNWWGTTDPAEIDEKIWDYNDDFNLGKVNYTPFLTEPNPEAMSDPNAPIPVINTSPSPSPSPGSSPAPSQNLTASYVVLLVVIAVLLGVIAVLLIAVVVFLRKRSAK